MVKSNRGNIRITINGMPGSGKSTLSRFLAKKLGLKKYGMGDVMREMAIEKGMTIAELNRLEEKEERTDREDREVDEYQKKLKNKDNIIVDGRLSWFFIPNSVKIFFKVDPKMGAERIFKDRRPSEKRYKSVEEAERANEKRVKSDIKRYKKLYGINPYDIKNYDIVMDTSDMTIPEMEKNTLAALKKFLG